MLKSKAAAEEEETLITGRHFIVLSPKSTKTKRLKLEKFHKPSDSTVHSDETLLLSNEHLIFFAEHPFNIL